MDENFTMEDANRMMNHRLNEARQYGYIANESGNKDWKFNENWKLTKLGEEHLKELEKELEND